MRNNKMINLTARDEAEERKPGGKQKSTWQSFIH